MAELRLEAEAVGGPLRRRPGVNSTIRKTTVIWPHKILVADMATLAANPAEVGSRLKITIQIMPAYSNRRFYRRNGMLCFSNIGAEYSIRANFRAWTALPQ